jgi:hypothetical protein
VILCVEMLSEISTKNRITATGVFSGRLFLAGLTISQALTSSSGWYVSKHVYKTHLCSWPDVFVHPHELAQELLVTSLAM